MKGHFPTTFSVVLVLIVLIPSSLYVFKRCFARTTETYRNLYTENVLSIPMIFHRQRTLSIYMTPNDFNHSLAMLSAQRPHTIQLTGTLGGGLPELYFTDAYSYNRFASSERTKVLTITSEPKHFLIVYNPARARLANVAALNGRRVGYVSDVDRNIMRVLSHSFEGSDFSSLQLVRGTREDLLQRMLTLTDDAVDAMCLFINLKDPFMKTLKRTPFALVDYDDRGRLDMSEVSVNIPSAVKDIITLTGTNPDTEMSSKGAANIFIIGNVIRVDTLLYGRSELEHSYGTEQGLVAILKHLFEPSRNSYYTQYFKFYDISIRQLRAFNQHVATTREQFEQEKDRTSMVTFVITTPVSGVHEYDGTRETMALNMLKWDGVRIRVGDRIKLQGQPREVENGYYYVTEVHDDVPRIIMKSHLLFVFNERFHEQNTMRGSDWIVTRAGDKGRLTIPVFNLFVDDTVVVSKLNRKGVVTRDPMNGGSLAVRLEPISISGDTPVVIRDPRYVCFEDHRISNPRTCRGTIDPFGRLKPPYTWDKPCQTDYDCPFFRANKNYQNNFGGCNMGYCEMPVGIRRKGFTQYEPTSSPRCHGCSPDVDPKQCCALQLLQGASPDYAFSSDRFERMERRNNQTLERF
jgi:hypothetical protein